MKIRASLACKGLTSILGLSALVVAGTAFAEDQLEEVVVTAQKRSQNIQDVPIAVTAITATELETKGINDVSKLSALAPNVQLDAGTPFSGSNAVLSAYIRGIGQNDFAFNQDPGVGVYVDGIYLARSVGANTTMMDVDRVEILKGPQGTLFGRNTIGGAISIVTRDPGKDFMFKGEMTTGQYNRFDAKFTMDIPITDIIQSTFSFSRAARDGYQRRIPFPGTYLAETVTDFPAAGYKTASREGSENQWNVRGKVVIHASDTVKLTVSGDFTDVDQSATPNTALGIDPVGLAGLYNACILGLAGPQVLGAPCGPRLGLTPTPSNPKQLPPVATLNSLLYTNQFQTGNIDTTYATGQSFSKLRNWGVGTTLDWALQDNLALKWIQAYRKLQWDTGMDLDGSPLPILSTSFDMPQHEVSEELQLNGKAIDDRLNFAVGAYYFRESGHLHDFVTFPAGLLMIDGPNDLTTRAEALYAHLNFKITDAFSVTAGARYTKEHKLFEGHQNDDNALSYKAPSAPLVPCFPPTAPSPVAGQDCQQYLGFPSAAEPYRYFPPGVNTLDFSNTSPTFGLEYRFTPDVMAYASYSKGYKTGSWTTRLSSPHPTYDASLHFDPEFATSQEVGVKSEWLDRRLRLNVAAFHTKYEGIQLNSQQGISPTLVNAGDAKIYGFEVESSALIAGGFSFDAAIGYTNAKYTSLNNVLDNGFIIQLGSCPERTSNPGGSCYLPKTPEWKIYGGPQYLLSLGNGGALQFNGDWTYTAKLANDFGNTQLLMRGATDIFNASITYKTPKDQLEFILGGTNLSDKRYIVSGQNQSGVAVIDASYNRPREWFASIRFLPSSK